MDLLLKSNKLPSKYKEHPLKGNFKNHLDCHIENDWLLIYYKDEDNKEITLIRNGTHQDIFGK